MQTWETKEVINSKFQGFMQLILSHNYIVFLFVLKFYEKKKQRAYKNGRDFMKKIPGFI